MKTILFKSDTRGAADHGWLKTNHTFSFANYYNPERVHFGALRVMNDDWIAPAEGFGKHPHDNMEIITIPFSGEVLHKDSMGNKGIIKPGEIQVMSAGTGIFHSEHNNSQTDPLTLFQIWIFPEKKNVKPRYDQITIADLAEKNEFYQILSPDPNDQGVWIHQQAWFNLGEADAGKVMHYQLKRSQSGVFVQMIEGEAEVAGIVLKGRDAVGLTEISELEFKALTDAKVLLMEIPMHW
jgi:hypothetical protein